MWAVFARPLRQYKLLILAVAILMLFIPQANPNDHQVNVEPLVGLIRVYDNPAAVYPPHALTLMMPFIIIGAALTRVLSIVLIGIYGLQQDWPVGRFMAVILNPIFVYTILFSNIDVIIVLIPVLFFERANIWVRALFLSMLMLKPQLGAFLALYYVIHYRAWQAALIGVVFTVAHFVLPNPAGNLLVFEWIDNILHPTDANSVAWTNNPVGPRWLVFVLFPIIYFVQRERWTQERTVASLLIFAMTISPYASFQSVVVPVSVLSGGLLTLVHWGLTGLQVISVVGYFVTTLILGGFDAVLIQKLRSTTLAR